jgi:hypothetical protein
VRATPGSVVVGYLDDHNWSACFGLSLRDLYLRDAAGPGRMVRAGGRELRKVAGTGGIPAGRNQVVAEFLDSTDGEWLWMVDTDMGFAPDTVDRLVAAADEHRRPVVGGLAFANRRVEAGPLHSELFTVVPTIYDWLELEDEVGFASAVSYPLDQVVKAAGTGAACLLMHRRVLAKMRARLGDVWFDPITHPTGLRGKPRTFSEDLSFCVRLATIDEPLHVDTSVKTVHHKGSVWLCEEMFLAQQAAASFEPVEPAAADTSAA